MDINKKILITGSNGLLGNAFKKILNSDNIFHTRNDCDLTNEKDTLDYINYQVKENGVNTIIHCAAKVGGVQANMNNNIGFFIENYNINSNIIKASFKNQVPNFVNILSTCIFPNDNITYPLTINQIDNGAPHPSNYGYSYAKRLSGYETKIFRNMGNLNWFSVIPTNIYGEHDNFSIENGHFIPSLIHKAFLSKILNKELVVWGDGNQLRQFIHADDLANLIIWSLENWNKEEHCMLINEEEILIKDIVDIVIEKFGIDKKNVFYDETKPKGQYRKPAKSDINDYNFKDIRIGINETIDWFINNYNTVRK